MFFDIIIVRNRFSFRCTSFGASFHEIGSSITSHRANSKLPAVKISPVLALLIPAPGSRPLLSVIPHSSEKPQNQVPQWIEPTKSCGFWGQNDAARCGAAAAAGPGYIVATIFSLKRRRVGNMGVQHILTVQNNTLLNDFRGHIFTTIVDIRQSDWSQFWYWQLTAVETDQSNETRNWLQHITKTSHKIRQ